MSEMNETDRKLAQELLAAWDGSSANRPAIEAAVHSMSEDAIAMVQTARRLVTAELAATPMADEDALVEVAARGACKAHYADMGWDETASALTIEGTWHDWLPEARAALSAIHPHIAALQARAEAAEAENARLQAECVALSAATCDAPYAHENGSMGCAAQDKLRAYIANLTDASQKYMDAIKALGKRVPDKPYTYFEASLENEADTITFWQNLNDAGIELSHILSARAALGDKL